MKGLREMLHESAKSNVLHIEKILKTVQEQVSTVFGPLCTLWSMMEEERYRAVCAGDQDELQETAMLFDKCLLLVAQSVNEISFQRRQSILSGLVSLTNQNTVKDILKNQSETLDSADNTYLFGPSLMLNHFL